MYRWFPVWWLCLLYYFLLQCQWLRFVNDHHLPSTPLFDMSTTTELVSVNGLDLSSTSSSISIRATKVRRALELNRPLLSSISQRKFDDALQSLDSAVAPAKPLPERPTAPKRPHMTRSLYSTLAKYGIQSNIPKPPIESVNFRGLRLGSL